MENDGPLKAPLLTFTTATHDFSGGYPVRLKQPKPKAVRPLHQVPVLALIVAFIFAFSGIVQTSYTIRMDMNGGGAAADLGAQFSRIDPRTVTASHITPQSPLSGYPFANSYQIRFDNPLDGLRANDALMTPEEIVRLSYLSQGGWRHISLRAIPISKTLKERYRVAAMSAMVRMEFAVVGLIAVFLMMLQPHLRHWSLFWLTMALIAFGYTDAVGFEGAAGFYPAFEAFFLTVGNLISAFMLLFAAHFFNEELSATRPLSGQFFIATANVFLLISVVVSSVIIYCYGNSIALPFLDRGTDFDRIYQFASSSVSGSIVIAGCLGDRKDAASRFRVLLIGFSSLAAAQIVGALTFESALSLFGILDIFGMVAGALAAPLLIFGVLTQNIWDVHGGHGLGKMMVFVVVGTLCALAELNVHHIIEGLGFEAWTYLTVFVGTVIFLIFALVHHVLQHGCERYFFPAFFPHEAALRKFLADCEYIDDPEKFRAGIIKVIYDFAHQAGTALYEYDELQNSFKKSASKGLVAADLIDLNDAMVAELRICRRCVNVKDVGSKQAAAIALPLRLHGELIGFVILAGKPSGNSYYDNERLELWKTAVKMAPLLPSHAPHRL